MRDSGTSIEDGYKIHKSEVLYEATKWTKQILETKYEAVMPQQIVDNCAHLNNEEKDELLKLLENFKDLFDGSLGTWKGKKLNIEEKDNAKPYHARAFPIPKSQKEGLKKEINRLCQFKVLKKVNHSDGLLQPSSFPKRMNQLGLFLTSES